MSRKKITLQPAEKHMDPGQVKLTVEHEVDGDRLVNSSSVYIPEALLSMLPGMVDSYRTNPQIMSGSVITSD